MLKTYAHEISVYGIPALRQRLGTLSSICNLNCRIMSILRRRGEPLTTLDIVDAVLA